jgi:hypothetical protein
MPRPVGAALGAPLALLRRASPIDRAHPHTQGLRPWIWLDIREPTGLRVHCIGVREERGSDQDHGGEATVQPIELG